MRIVVASGNIFRRELSVFVLSEAGHQVVEVSDATMLLEGGVSGEPQIVLVDALLAQGDVAALRRRIGERSAARILWITGGIGLPELPEIRADGCIHWPYNPEELLHALDHLIAPDLLLQPLRERYARDHS